MAVYFAAAAVLLFYLCCVPVKFAVEMRIRQGAAFGAGGSIFEGRYALRGAH